MNTLLSKAEREVKEPTFERLNWTLSLLIKDKVVVKPELSEANRTKGLILLLINDNAAVRCSINEPTEALNCLLRTALEKALIVKRKQMLRRLVS